MEYYDKDYLEHHGILGQKWGVRRFQNADGSLTSAGKKHYGAESTDKISSRKGTQRRLNELDQAIAFNKRKLYESAGKYNKAKKSLEKHEEGSKAAIRSEAKMKKSQADFDEAAKYINAGKKEIDRIVKEADSKGLTISSKDTLRSVTRGKDWLSSTAKSIAISAITAPLGATVQLIPNSTVAGTKYKVKEKKSEEKIDPKVEAHKETNKVSKWNDSKSYNKDFLNYLKKEGSSKPEDIDDHEYLELYKMEYEENTGKKAMKE